LSLPHGSHGTGHRVSDISWSSWSTDTSLFFCQRLYLPRIYRLISQDQPCTRPILCSRPCLACTRIPHPHRGSRDHHAIRPDKFWTWATTCTLHSLKLIPGCIQLWSMPRSMPPDLSASFPSSAIFVATFLSQFSSGYTTSSTPDCLLPLSLLT